MQPKDKYFGPEENDFSIDEVWLEAFVRKVIEKVKAEDFNNELFYKKRE